MPCCNAGLAQPSSDMSSPHCSACLCHHASTRSDRYCCAGLPVTGRAVWASSSHSRMKLVQLFQFFHRFQNYSVLLASSVFLGGGGQMFLHYLDSVLNKSVSLYCGSSANCPPHPGYITKFLLHNTGLSRFTLIRYYSVCLVEKNEL